MKTIYSHFGSFIPFEICRNNKSGIYHEKALRLNTARNALQVLISKRKIRKIYIPFYSCKAIYTPLIRLNIPFEFYKINNDFSPNFEFNKLEENEYFLYINFFGINDSVIQNLNRKTKNLIIDNSQSFFSLPINELPTIYSARKFFGVADGAFLYDPIEYKVEFQQDISFERYNYLFINLDLGQKPSYKLYTEEEEKLDNEDIKLMSNLTEIVLNSIPFETYNSKRLLNFDYLHGRLKNFNQLKNFRINKSPLCYPLLIDNGKEIKEQLIKENIFLPTYWNNVLENVEQDSFEFSLVNDLLPIHIDQRYDKNQLKIVVERIINYIK